MIFSLPVIRTFVLRRLIRRVREASDRPLFERRLRDLVVYVSRGSGVRRVLRQFKAGAHDIRELYGFLMQGAYRSAHGAEAALYSITNPIIIYAYLRDRNRRSDRQFALSFADTCLRHFDGGHTDRFLLGMLAVPENFSPRGGLWNMRLRGALD